MTGEHLDDTAFDRGDPEDRIFVFRMPALENRWEKSKDNIEFVWKGQHLVGPGQELLGANKEGGLDSGKTKTTAKGRMRAGGKGRQLEAISRAFAGGGRMLQDAGEEAAVSDVCIPASTMLIHPYITQGPNFAISVMVIPGVWVGGRHLAHTREFPRAARSSMRDGALNHADARTNGHSPSGH